MTKLVLDEAIEAAQTYFQDYRIDRKRVRKQSKERKYVRVRSFVAAFMRARDPSKFSYPVIARALDKKDHTTVLHAVRQAHKEWGERLFLKLAAVRPVETGEPESIEQPFHSVSPAEILAVGERNMARFINGKGWEQAA